MFQTTRSIKPLAPFAQREPRDTAPDPRLQAALEGAVARNGLEGVGVLVVDLDRNRWAGVNCVERTTGRRHEGGIVAAHGRRYMLSILTARPADADLAGRVADLKADLHFALGR